MRSMEPNSVDAIVTDPPYGLEFMGKEWDHGIPGIPFWIEALRVAKPGCHLLAFGGTRTFHRLACAIEDAGWEIRDTLMWVYGSGFPKSEGVSLAIDKKACRIELEARLGRKPTKEELAAAWEGYRMVVGEYIWPDGKPRNTILHSTKRNGKYSDIKTDGSPNDRTLTAPATDAARQWEGWGTALKPAYESIVLARKPLEGTVAANVQKWGCGAINIDGCRVGYPQGDNALENGLARATMPRADIRGGGFHTGTDWGEKKRIVPSGMTSRGRWPANLIHDGSEEVLELFPQTKSGGNIRRKPSPSSHFGSGSNESVIGTIENHGDSGSAARFFKSCPVTDMDRRLVYCAKASRAEREAGCEGMEEHDSNYREEYRPMAIDSGDKGQDTPYAGVNRSGGVRNHHPTVKPLALMRWLVKLVAYPGDTVLDPFMGSGTTGVACVMEGRKFLGIEQDAEYIKIAQARIAHARQQEAAKVAVP